MSIPLHEIWYYADAKVALYMEDYVESHTFADGKGVLTIRSTIRNAVNWLRGTPINKVEIADNFVSIASYSFYRCLSLTSVILPKGMTIINDYAFTYDPITYVSFPDSLTTIGKTAFGYCSSLAITSLPDNITSLGDYAFRGCTSIPFMVLTFNSMPTWGTSVFLNLTFPIFVPPEMVDSYKAELPVYAYRIFPISNISSFKNIDGNIHLLADYIWRKRIVKTLRYSDIADDEHYPSEHCLAVIASALQSDIYAANSAMEIKTNKVTTLDNSDTHYPSAKAVKTAVDAINNSLTALVQLVQLKEVLVNKVTSISAQSTDVEYPSAKAVWTVLQSIQPSAQGSTFGDGGFAYTYTDDGYNDIVLDGDTESGSLLYLEVSTHYPQYDFYFENITDAAHGIHSLIVENNTGQPFFIAFNDVDSFPGYIYIGAYGDGMTKPAYNLQPGSRVKLDFYLNSSYVFMTAAVI